MDISKTKLDINKSKSPKLSEFKSKFIKNLMHVLSWLWIIALGVFNMVAVVLMMCLVFWPFIIAVLLDVATKTIYEMSNDN